MQLDVSEIRRTPPSYTEQQPNAGSQGYAGSDPGSWATPNWKTGRWVSIDRCEMHQDKVWLAGTNVPKAPCVVQANGFTTVSALTKLMYEYRGHKDWIAVSQPCYTVHQRGPPSLSDETRIYDPRYVLYDVSSSLGVCSQ